MHVSYVYLTKPIGMCYLSKEKRKTWKQIGFNFKYIMQYKFTINLEQIMLTFTIGKHNTKIVLQSTWWNWRPQTFDEIYWWESWLTTIERLLAWVLLLFF